MRADMLTDQELGYAKEMSEKGYPLWRIAHELYCAERTLANALLQRRGYRVRRDRPGLPDIPPPPAREAPQ